MQQSPNVLENMWEFARGAVGGRTRNFWLYESSVWFHMLANSLISIFIPVLMFQNGFSIKEILFFFVFFHGLNAPLNFVGQWLVAHLGPRGTVIIATLFQIGFFVVYANINSGSWMALVTLGFFAAVYDALYYVASFYILMNTTKDINNTGKNTGLFYAVSRSAALLGPIIGSAILLATGQSTYVIIGVVSVFVLSLIPLLRMKLDLAKAKVSTKISDFLKDGKNIQNYIQLACYKIHETTAGNLWPLFIFAFFGELESVAVLAVLVPMTSLVFSFLSGHIDQGRRNLAIGAGALLLGLTWVGRLAIENGTFYYLSVIAAGVFTLLVQVPLDAKIFRHGKEIDSLLAATFRNAVSMGIKFLYFGLLYLMAETYDIFQTAFGISAGALMVLFIMTFYISRTVEAKS